MKTEIERRDPEGILDYFALAVTTFGVGYIPFAPGTFGSMVGVGVYFLFEWSMMIIAVVLYGPEREIEEAFYSSVRAIVSVSFVLFCMVGVWASGRCASILGNLDPPEAVVDEVMGQLIVFLFIPFTFSWQLILAGFLLFRFFDIWKPYPIHMFENMPGGLGICADDIVAGVYAGVALSVVYAVSLSV